MNRWMDGETDGRMDGWVDGQYKRSSREKRSKGIRLHGETVRNVANFEIIVASVLHTNVCADTRTHACVLCMVSAAIAPCVGAICP